MLILSFNALTSPALLKAVRIQVRPWMQWATRHYGLFGL